MSADRFRRKVAKSRAARLAALPTRFSAVARHDAKVAADSVRWLVRSREHTNYTYDLQALNITHLAWFVSEVSGAPVGEIRGYLEEIHGDEQLRQHIIDRTLSSNRRGLADTEVRYGRRIGWYALVRAMRPEHVVETGTDKGLGSCVLAAAILRNGRGRVTTLDVNPDAGYLVAGDYRDVIDLRTGDSLQSLVGLDPIDIFIHDSAHTRAHEDAELRTAPLAPSGIAMSDNAHVTDVLPAWAEETGRRFLYFQERPARHWYPGGGIGVAWICNSW